MKLIFTSYVSTNEYDDPAQWLKRIEAYTGILESLGRIHKVTSIEKINYEGDYEQNGVRYIFTRQKQKTVRFPFRMHRLIKKLQPDIVFINGLIFPLQIMQLKLRVGRKVKIICLHRAEKPFRGIKKYLQIAADPCIDAYLFSSFAFSDRWKSNIDPGKMKEVMQASSIFSPTNQSYARTITGIHGDPVFLWVGRLDANKDPLTVVSAFLDFVRLQTGARLYMIYQNQDLLVSLKQLVDSDENGASVILVGQINHGELENWYNSADFIISGSHYEGGGTSVVEAMSCGCIPVVTDISSFQAITGKGNCGLLYEPGNKNALLQALQKTSGMHRLEERQRTLQQFKDELSFDAIARKINSIIASIQSNDE